MKNFIQKAACVFLLLLMCSNTGISWEQVYTVDFVIGDDTVQDFSKENLVFHFACHGNGVNRVLQIKILQPNRLAHTTISNYVLGTNIHYDGNHFLRINALTGTSECSYSANIWKRK